MILTRVPWQSKAAFCKCFAGLSCQKLLNLVTCRLQGLSDDLDTDSYFILMLTFISISFVSSSPNIFCNIGIKLSGV